MTFFSSLTKPRVLIEMTSCTGRSAVRCGAWHKKTALVSRKLGTHTHTLTGTGSLVQKRNKMFMSLHRPTTEIQQTYQQHTEQRWRQVQEHSWKPENTTSVMSTGPAAVEVSQGDVGIEARREHAHLVCVSMSMCTLRLQSSPMESLQSSRHLNEK